MAYTWSHVHSEEYPSRSDLSPGRDLQGARNPGAAALPPSRAGRSRGRLNPTSSLRRSGPAHKYSREFQLRNPGPRVTGKRTCAWVLCRSRSGDGAARARPASSRTVIDLVTLSQHTGERMARFRSPIGRTIACAARPGGGARACRVAAFRPPSCGCTWEGADATLYRSEAADGSYVLGRTSSARRA